MAPLPKIAITMGDPAGIGPEVCLKLLDDPSIGTVCVPMILGDAIVLQQTASALGQKYDVSTLKLSDLNDRADFETVTHPVLVDFATPEIDRVVPGLVDSIAGKAAYDYIDQAIHWSLSDRVDGVCTGPINKLALQAAGFKYPGHTEIFAERTQTENFCMMQYSDSLTCSFVTTHVGYADVPSLLTVERILEVIAMSAKAVTAIKRVEPTIVVCGLNPHAGEDGLFGFQEEEKIIAPAIKLAKDSGLNVIGPLPPDTCFIPSRRASTDCFICMYHDQGHIPLKALVFDSAVNTTLGLPIIRTSVDHGTAFDIVRQNQADPGSMINAVKLAALLARN